MLPISTCPEQMRMTLPDGRRLLLTTGNCEKRLCEVVQWCLDARIATVEELQASPLRQALMFAMRFWAEWVALRRWGGLIFDSWEEPGDFAGDWLVMFFSPGRNGDVYNRLESLLCFVNAHGSRTAPAYLQRCVNNYCLDRLDEYERGECLVGPFTRLDGSGHAEEIMPSEAPDPHYRDVEKQVIHRMELERFISRLGGDLLQDLAVLCHALRIPRHQVAVMVFARRHKELCREVMRSISVVLDGDFTQAWQPFLRAAEDFRLPADVTSLEALERHMYRRTSKRAREEFCRRTGGRPA